MVIGKAAFVERARNVTDPETLLILMRQVRLVRADITVTAFTFVVALYDDRGSRYEGDAKLTLNEAIGSAIETWSKK